MADADTARAAHSEAALLGTLDHPNLMRLHEVITRNDSVVLVLDLAAGGSLAELVRARGRLTPGEVVAALAPVGAALAAAHAHGITHGDVTPANVVFTDIGLPLLADLGVARITGDDRAVRSTPAFVDPTVAAGAIPGPPSDVFMLAATAVFALTGTVLWPGEDTEQVLAAARNGHVAVGSALAAAAVPEPMVELLVRALSLEPQRRGTAADFALELRHASRPVGIELTAGRERATAVPLTGTTGRRAAYVPRHVAPPRGRAGPAETGSPARPDPSLAAGRGGGRASHRAGPAGFRAPRAHLRASASGDHGAVRTLAPMATLGGGAARRAGGGDPGCVRGHGGRCAGRRAGVGADSCRHRGGAGESNHDGARGVGIGDGTRATADVDGIVRPGVADRPRFGSGAGSGPD